MKRFVLTILLMGVLVVFMEPAQNLLSKFLRQEEPTRVEIQTGDWLSKLALKYYGDASYWKELALINRAPDGDMIFPGENVIIPSFQVVNEIRKTRSLSKVNELVREQQDVLAGRPHSSSKPLAGVNSQDARLKDGTGLAKQSEEPPLSNSKDGGGSAPVGDQNNYASFDESPMTNGTEEASFWLSTPAIIGTVVLGFALLVGVFMFIGHKQRQEEVAQYGAGAGEPDEEEEDTDILKEFGYHRFDDEHVDKKNGRSKTKSEASVS